MRDPKKTKKLEIAAAAGGGLSLSDAAKVAGVSSGDAQVTIATIKTEPAMEQMYDQFRQMMVPRIHRLFRKTVAKINTKIDQASFRELVSLYHELAPASGVTPEAATSETTATVTGRLDMSKPEVIKAMREVLSQERTLNSPAVAPLPAKEAEVELKTG